MFLLGYAAPIRAWYLQPGEVYVGYYAVESKSKTLTRNDGSTSPFPDISWFSQFMLVSAGVFKRAEVHGALAYVVAREREAPDINVNSPGDSWLGGSYALYSERDSETISLKLRADVKIPLANYPTSQHTAIGQGQNDYRISANVTKFWQVLGVSMAPFAEPIYIFRAQEPEDQLALKAGLNIYLPANLRAGFSVSSLRTLAGSAFGEPNWTYLNLRVWYTTLDISIGCTLFDRFYVDVIYARTIASGNSLLFDHFGGHAGPISAFRAQSSVLRRC
jgi:hypothetical protein